MKVMHSVREKKVIAAEANSVPNNLKATAQKYNIQPCLIHSWKRAIIEKMMQWIDLILHPFCCIEKGLHTYLIWYEFSKHLMQKTIHIVQDTGTQVEFVPAGYTGAVQIFDSINKPFKDYTRKKQNSINDQQPEQEIYNNMWRGHVEPGAISTPNFSGFPILANAKPRKT